ncbi:MAG: Gfo/Idh/MocA family oxidoreductase [Chitinophagaceae bacterium]|nr:Gfo/Idh/MocA family oxidoreductase [Chitinophagaceae bacterium]
MEKVNVGIIGGGLMGQEAASAFARWFVLKDFPIQPVLKAVCDQNESVLSWYRNISTVTSFETNYKNLLANAEIDVVYAALPHHLHQQVYTDILLSGKDLLAEKPFGINEAAASSIVETTVKLKRFVRCSSEFPFMPAARQLIRDLQSSVPGRIMAIKAGFLHSGDMDPLKPLNWKRQSAYCGEIGVMGDLGMHAMHIPLRMGWKPDTVYAQLQKIITKRPDGQGGWGNSDTWNNASLHMSFRDGYEKIPMTVELKRLAPGETNTWYLEVFGTNGSMKYSTGDVKGYRRYFPEHQSWHRKELGLSGMAFPVTSGGIFEPGFPDCFQQMLAAYFAERAGVLNEKFGCVTPAEAYASHKIFKAALVSSNNSTVEKIYW